MIVFFPMGLLVSGELDLLLSRTSEILCALSVVDMEAAFSGSGSPPSVKNLRSLS